MADLFGELRYAIGVDLYRQAPLFGFRNHFFISRLVDMPAEQHNIFFFIITALMRLDERTIVKWITESAFRLWIY